MPACFDLLTEEGTVSTINTGPNTEIKKSCLKIPRQFDEISNKQNEDCHFDETNSLEASENGEEYESDEEDESEEYESDEYNDEEDEELKADDEQSLSTSIGVHSKWTNGLIGNFMHGLENSILDPLLLCDANQSQSLIRKLSFLFHLILSH